MGTKFTVNISGSQIGNIQQGPGAIAVGAVSIGTPEPLTPARHLVLLQEAQAALVQDQDALDALDERLFPALHQFLRAAREIPVEGRSHDQVRADLFSRFEQTWAAQGLGTLKLPPGAKVVLALLGHPGAEGVVRKLVGG